MLGSIIGLLLVIPPGRPFPEERVLLDRRLETLRRILPDGPATSADILHVRDLAESAGLARVEIEARSPLESGTRGETPLHLTALGGYEEIAQCFSQLDLSHRLVDVETLTLTSTREGLTRLESVLRLPHWPRGAPLPPPPESPNGRPARVSRPVLEAFLRDKSLALAKSEAIATWRRARRNPRLFLSELAAIVRDRPVVLGYASLAEEFTVRGVAVGEGTARGLESRFERGFFRISDFLMAKQGACHRFEVRGRSPVAGPDAPLPLPLEDPFVQDEAPCRADRDLERRIAIRGPTPSARKAGSGPLTVRLRGVDFADVFQVLSLVSGSGFLVDEEVVGRVGLDVSRQTLEETLALIRRQGKVEIVSWGPAWRVSRTRPEPRAAAPSGGNAVSFHLKRAEVRDLLAVMTDIDPELAVLGPPGFLGRLSVWASGVSLDGLRSATLDAVGLVERIEEDRRVLERPTGTGEAPIPVAGSGPPARLTLRPEELAVLEFELAGVASSGDGWLAFAYAPTGQLHTYRPGDRLADAVVRSIESTDVVLETSEGPLRVPLRPLDD